MDNIEHFKLEDLRVHPDNLVVGKTYLRIRRCSNYTTSSRVEILRITHSKSGNINRIYAKHVSGGKKGSIFSDSVVISTGSIKTGTTPITYIDGQFVKDEDISKITE